MNVYVEPLFDKCLSKDDSHKERIDVQKRKELFFRQFELLSSRVKQYQRILNNMEALELLDCMHETLPYNIKSKIFTAALYDDAQQYYAISNAMKFVIIESWLVFFPGCYSGVMDWYRPCFLAELYEDDRPTICFSDDGSQCELYCLDRSVVKAYSHPDDVDSTFCLGMRYKRASIGELVAFVNKDSKQARVEAFKKLFAGWVEYLSNETNKEKYTNAFIELLSRLNWHDIELVTEEDCKKVLKRESTLYNIENW